MSLHSRCTTTYYMTRMFSNSAITMSRNNKTMIDKNNSTIMKLVSPMQKDFGDSVRNVGIIAHIDAGKTTTTERFLYYSGVQDKLGSVDRGTTATDYMDQERERGITIQSAAISTRWRRHRINLIDTPGHVDFTMEVERSLWVVDGAVGILDASAGVEAQTLTVWKQANKFNLPRLLYLNKMDKTNADLQSSLDSVKKQLKVKPLMVQLNVGVGRDFEGVIDLMTLNLHRWKQNSVSQDFECIPLSRTEYQDLYDRAVQERNNLIDDLADLSTTMLEEVINSSSYDDIKPELIRNTVREVTCDSKAVPVLLGSSLKNCGVQPLLDAVVDYLPAPADRSLVKHLTVENEVCAFAFKTIHEKERGAVTFLRVFSGTLKPSMNVYNNRLETSEKIGRLYAIFANQLIDIKLAGPGSIVAVTGLDKTITGDVLLTDKRTVSKYNSEGVTLPTLDVPDPVFMCSIEPYSTRQQKALNSALQCLIREDPSLRLSHDTETDQLILSGMGELQLEVIKDRLLREFDLETYCGSLMIAYKEIVEQPSKVITHEINRTLGDTTHHFTVSLSVEPSNNINPDAIFVSSDEENWTQLRWQHKKSIIHGVRQALNSGPLLGYPVVNCQILLHSFMLHSRRTSAAVISAGVCEAIHEALTSAGVLLSEPLMKIQIYCDQQHVGAILNDLAQRQASVESVSEKDERSYILASSAVVTLLGYSSCLRKITSGRSTLMMEVKGYTTMTKRQTQLLVNKCKGFMI